MIRYLRFISTAEHIKLSKSLFRLSDNENVTLFSSGRNIIWKVYWQQALKKPILGNGFDQTRIHFKRFVGNSSYQFATPKAHNIYLKIFTDFGLIGLCFLLLILFISIRLLAIIAYDPSYNNELTSIAWIFLALWSSYHLQALLGHEGPYGKEWYVWLAIIDRIVYIYRNPIDKMKELTT